MIERAKDAGRRRAITFAGRRQPIDLIVWAAALVPLVLPPVFALLIAWRRRGDGPSVRIDPTWVSIVALANLAVTLVLILRYGGDALAIAESLRHWWLPLFNGSGQRPELTPV